MTDSTIKKNLVFVREPIIHNRVNYGKERTFSESEVKELLQKQRELCESKAMSAIEGYGGSTEISAAIRNAVLTI